MNQSSSASAGPSAHGKGSKDGVGAADNDQPFRFGRRPTVMAPFPFTTQQFARLLILRSQVEAQRAGA
jgi:hypothetical protein